MKLTKEIELAVEKYIINNISQHPNDLVPFVMHYFDLSRPTVMRLIGQMMNEGLIERGNPKGRYPKYKLKTKYFSSVYNLEEKTLQEDIVFYKSVMPHLEDLPTNIQRLFEYAGMEIINNGIEHSGGKKLEIRISRNAKQVRVDIVDDGVGVFNKIQKDLGLLTPQQSILELCKGKFTSDPKRHSGEGIFFSSRMVDQFIIWSYGVFFSGHENNDMILEIGQEDTIQGTFVRLGVDLDTTRTPVEVFEQYADQDMIPTFHKTCIPVRFMNVEGGNLVSRSQAKRLLARVDRFKTVILDFEGVEMIGQAFADEIFRVFKAEHKDVILSPKNMNPTVQAMVRHIESSIQ